MQSQHTSGKQPDLTHSFKQICDAMNNSADQQSLEMTDLFTVFFVQCSTLWQCYFPTQKIKNRTYFCTL